MKSLLFHPRGRRNSPILQKFRLPSVFPAVELGFSLFSPATQIFHIQFLCNENQRKPPWEIPLKQAFRSIALALLLGSASLSYAQLEGSKPDTQPVNHPVPAIQDTETPAQRDTRMQWRRETRFGMVIHSGLYSIP